jgi:hypothetical protein
VNTKSPHIVVAGVGPGADLSLGEPRRRLLMVWRRGLVAQLVKLVAAAARGAGG